MEKVLVLLSGGVDSSYTLYILKNSGYDVSGLYLKMHDLERYHKKNLENIKKVCQALKVNFYVLDLKNEFRACVYEPFIKWYIDGLTPNPCVMCNPNIKFKKSLEFASSLGINKLASGHYVLNDGEFLYKAKDGSKDQSYFLYRVPKEYLKRLIFPLGDRFKKEVKEEALKIPILKELALQKESQEICFVEDSYIDVLKKHTNVDMPGNVLNRDAKVIGKHKGYMHYTIGKRKGFSIKGSHKPYYVLSINPKDNTITVGEREELAKRVIKLRDINLFLNTNSFEAEVKIRYKTTPIKAHIKIETNSAIIEFLEPVYGVALGQSAVFYDKDRLLGGGIIIEAM